jgi:hypothetical protein
VTESVYSCSAQIEIDRKYEKVANTRTLRTYFKNIKPPNFNEEMEACRDYFTTRNLKTFSRPDHEMDATAVTTRSGMYVFSVLLPAVYP